MRQHKSKKYIIEKQDTTTTTNYTTQDYTTQDYTTQDYTDDYDEYYSETEDVTSVPATTTLQTTNEERVIYTSIVNSKYKKPQSGSRQDRFTKEEILKRLENYIPLKTMQDKRVLERLPVFKTWVRYYNTQTKQFRVGGLLMKVVYPDYIMLINTARNLTWSVQLKDNIIYIPHPKVAEEKRQEKKRDNVIKDKLLEMYKQGKLTTKK